jgi:GLPGLI family protein
MYSFNKELNPKIMSELDRKGETIQDISGDFTILNRQDISNDFLFKDFKNKNFIYKMQNGGRIFDGKDVFLNWSWNLKEEYKTILNYKCQKATCVIDDVNYIAWFTKEIPVMDLPYKYTGLPGLILEFSNKYFQIIAQKASIEKENTILEKPEEPIESYTLEEMYSKAKKTLFTPSKSFFKADPNATMEIKAFRN